MVDWKCLWFQIRFWVAPLYHSHPHWWSINSSSCFAALLWSLGVCPNEELRRCDILAWGHWRISRTCLSRWILLILISSACAGRKYSEDQLCCPYWQAEGGFGKSVVWPHAPSEFSDGADPHELLSCAWFRSALHYSKLLALNSYENCEGPLRVIYFLSASASAQLIWNKNL